MVYLGGPRKRGRTGGAKGIYLHDPLLAIIRPGLICR